MLRGAVLLLLCASLLLAQGALPSSDVLESRRKALDHHALVVELTASLEAEGDEEARALLARDLALVHLEAQLLARIVPLEELATARPKGVLEDLAALEKTPAEALTLARFAFLLGDVDAGETALGEARDGDAELAAETDRLLAEARGESVPEGGYVRYRGEWFTLDARDRCRALDEALEALAAVELRDPLVPFEPSRVEPNAERFAAVSGLDAANARLRASCALVRESLEGDYEEVRRWLQTYVRQPRLRDELLAAYEAIAPERKKALELIARYEKPQQPQVDDCRERLEAMYAELEKLIERDFARLQRVTPEEAWALHERLRRREGALAAVDRYFAVAGLERLPTEGIRPVRGSTVTTVHLLPGREQSGLEDVLWLLVKFRAGQLLDTFARAGELQQQRETLTPWERLVVEELVCRSIQEYNDTRVVHSLDPTELEFVEILNRYRRVLGLRPFELEERLDVCSRKHSQEMVDLGYFGHISPIARNRGPSDRARLEGFAGGVGENCLAGGVDGRGAFEGWYHSPGHHRNLVSAGPQLGVGAVAGHSMWTMVCGGSDGTWRSLHRDLPPAERRRLDELEEAQLSAELPEALPGLARLAFAAARQPFHEAHDRFPGLLASIAEADLPVSWRAIQVAAVAGLIESLRYGHTAPLREEAWQRLRPYLLEAFPFVPGATEAKRASVVRDLSRHWEDVAQWRYRADSAAGAPEPPRVVERVGDGASLRSPRKVLSPRERLRMAKRGGGGTETETAVERGLEFLAKVQDEDGAWRARSFALGFDPSEGDPGRGDAEWEVAMTGLSLLAFCSAGYTTEQGEHREVVRRGVEFLMAHILDYGRFETASSHYMYSHAIATQALCELYSFSADPQLGVCAQLATDYLVYAQHQPSGGWRYEANEPGDTSVSGWVILALNAAYKAELDVAGFRGALRFLDSVTQRPYYHTGYLDPFDRATDRNRLTAVAMTGRLFLGVAHESPQLKLPAWRLIDDLPAENRIDFYYWYYATLCLFQLGEPYWKKWNAALVDTLLEEREQHPRSAFLGSWAPRGEHAGSGGRLYQTALAVLMLTTYYRYDRAPKQRIHPYTGDIAAEIEPYLAALRDEPDEHRRRIASRKLVDKFGPSMAPILLGILREGSEPVEYRRRLAVMLADVAAPRHAAPILELLAEGDDQIVTTLLQVLPRILSRESVPVLQGYLEHGSREVRIFCARSLARLAVPSATRALGERLEREADGGVRAELEKALLGLSHRSALAALVERILPGDEVGLLAVLDGLEPLERSGLIEPLVAMIDAEPRREREVRAALEEHRESALIPLLLIQLEDPELEVRQRAVQLLRALTCKHFGFEPNAGSGDRKKGLEHWQQWWKQSVEQYAPR